MHGDVWNLWLPFAGGFLSPVVSCAITQSGTSLRGSKIQMNGWGGGRGEEGEGRGAGKGEVGAGVWVERGRREPERKYRIRERIAFWASNIFPAHLTSQLNIVLGF